MPFSEPRTISLFLITSLFIIKSSSNLVPLAFGLYTLNVCYYLCIFNVRLFYTLKLSTITLIEFKFIYFFDYKYIQVPSTISVVLIFFRVVDFSDVFSSGHPRECYQSHKIQFEFNFDFNSVKVSSAISEVILFVFFFHSNTL